MSEEKKINKGKGCAIVALGIIVSFILSVVIIGMSIRGSYLTAMNISDKLDAQVTANQITYDSMYLKFREMFQITDAYADNCKEMYMGMISGRYEDIQPMFNMVQESNPTLDASLYTNVQTAIESSREEFKQEQKKVADIVREYNSFIRKHFIMNFFMQFEKKSADDYIVLTGKTRDAFESGVVEEIDITGKKDK